METPSKFIIAELSIRKVGSSSVLIIIEIIIESSAITNLRGVSTKLNKYIIFTKQTYKELINVFSCYWVKNFYQKFSGGFGLVYPLEKFKKSIVAQSLLFLFKICKYKILE